MQRYSMDAVVYDNVPSSHKAPPGVEKRTPQRSRRSRSSRWRLALVVTAQNLLVALCLAVTLYVHWNAPQQESNRHEGKGIYIRFEPIGNMYDSAGVELELLDGQNNNQMDVNNNQINIKCTGPYILYMNMCYAGIGNGNLSLQVKGADRDFTSDVPLHAPTVKEKCEGLHKMVHLSNKDNATLHFISKNLRITSINNLGLTYLLGSYCYF